MKLKSKPALKKGNPVFSVLYTVLVCLTIPVYLAWGPLYEYVSARHLGRSTDVDYSIETEETETAGVETIETETAEEPLQEESATVEETETEPEYVTVYNPGYADENYFDDAAFIGDSRTIGLYDYTGIEADYYCSKGYCAYQWKNGKKTIFQNTGEKVDLGEVLLDNQYGKVYLMVGLNDGGFGSAEDFRGRVQAMVTCILQTQPEAVVFLMANLHVTQKWGSAHPHMNNDFLTQANDVLSEISETDERLFYLDVNPFYCDDDGNLRTGLTSDGVHLHASEYGVWTEFLKSAAVYVEEVPKDEAQ